MRPYRGTELDKVHSEQTLDELVEDLNQGPNSQHTQGKKDSCQDSKIFAVVTGS